MAYKISKIVDSIVHDDCMNVLPDLPDDTFDLAFCDPPYNCGCDYNGYEDKMSDEDYMEWCRKWFTEVRRVAVRVIITPGHGNMWMWGSQIEKPFGTGCWFKPGNPASSVLGWCCWEPWLYYCSDRKIIGGPDSFRIPVTKQPDTGSHPCPKPLEFLKKLINKTTKVGGRVLDPFSGSGTTCMAAKILERHYVGIEYGLTYVNESRTRLDSVIDIFG